MIFSERGVATRSVAAWTSLILMFSVVAMGSALAQETSLTGSNFEIDTDANLRVDGGDPQSIDWANVAEARKIDLPTGSGDDSFGQGTKEDSPVPTVVDGSIPPNKSDLKTFGVYVEENGGKFLHLFWTRVQDPRGTTNMDFEFNQSDVISPNGVTPERTAGDLLIVYELSKGGTVPQLFLFTWLDGTENPQLPCEAANSYPCWGERTALTGSAIGSINTSLIPAEESDGLGALDPRTFGEASIDLSIIFDKNRCQSFGSAYLKSRSSDSFTAALKDFIAPQDVNITNCGKVIIRKQTDPDEDPNETLFRFSKTFGTDPATPDTFSLTDDGVATFNNVLFGSGYEVQEDDIPTGWDLDGISCSSSTGVTPVIGTDTVTFSIDDASDVLDCTFTNKARGAIIVEKITNDGFGSFQFTSNTLTPSPFTLATTEPGVDGKDSRTFGNLVPGTYNVAETVPDYWNLASSTCDDGSDPASIGLSAGETVTCTFENEREVGSIVISKTRKHAADGLGDHPHVGVTFTITGGELTSGVDVVTGDDGTVCYDGLVVSGLVGDYTVTETVPTGYKADGPISKTVTVTESACPSGAGVSFSNTPYTNLSVSVDSQIDGGTASTIDCALDSASTGANGDGSLTLNNLLPGTYTCTIVIDP